MPGYSNYSFQGDQRNVTSMYPSHSQHHADPSANQYPQTNMTYRFHTATNEMEWLKLQLHERDLRINSLEASLRGKDVTIARIEERLDHATMETQAALRTAMLIFSSNGHMFQAPALQCMERGDIKTERDTESLQFAVKEKCKRCSETQNLHLLVPEVTTSDTRTPPDSSSINSQVSFTGPTYLPEDVKIGLGVEA
jgi:hypothetical protein